MKIYTFRVTCSFTMQHSFVETDVEHDPEGRDSDLIPTEAALSALKGELEAALGDNHAISSITGAESRCSA